MRKKNPVSSKVREGGGEGAPGTEEGIPLKPVEQTVLEQVYPKSSQPLGKTAVEQGKIRRKEWQKQTVMTDHSPHSPSPCTAWAWGGLKE